MPQLTECVCEWVSVVSGIVWRVIYHYSFPFIFHQRALYISWSWSRGQRRRGSSSSSSNAHTYSKCEAIARQRRNIERTTKCVRVKKLKTFIRCSNVVARGRFYNFAVVFSFFPLDFFFSSSFFLKILFASHPSKSCSVTHQIINCNWNYKKKRKEKIRWLDSEQFFFSMIFLIRLQIIQQNDF